MHTFLVLLLGFVSGAVLWHYSLKVLGRKLLGNHKYLPQVLKSLSHDALMDLKGEVDAENARREEDYG